MFIKLKVYRLSSYDDDSIRQWRVINTDHIVTVLRNDDGLMVYTSDGKYCYVDPGSEKVLLDAIRVTI